MRTILYSILLLATLATMAAAQALPAATGPGGSDDSGLVEGQSYMASPITGQGGSLEYSSELTRSNYIRGGLGFTTTYDDNVLNTSDNTLSDVSYAILPHIELDQTRGRLKWMLDYSGGVTLNQRLTSRNQGSHNAGLKFDYRLSPHVTLRLTDRFTDTTSFFTTDNNFFGTPTGGVLQSPNSSLITPLARQLGNFSEAGLDYQLGAGTIVGGSGSYYFTHFSDVTDGTGNSNSLLNTKSAQAQGYFNHRLTARNWGGLTYRFQRLTFGSGINQTIAHSILYYHTIYLQPTMTLSLFAGPEYTDVSSQTVTQVIQLPFILVTSTPVDHQSWSASGGATFAWQGRHTSMQAGFVRRVNDGGGVLGAVRMNSVDVAARRQLSAVSNLLVGATYAVNDSIDFTTTPGSSIRGASGRIGYERLLAHNLNLAFGYARENQNQKSTGVPAADINHNRGWITLSYDFSRPLGR